MAISRAQLFKELIPGLNELFSKEYARYGNPLGVEMTPEQVALIEYTPQAMLDLWRAAFGDEAGMRHVLDKLEGNDMLTNIGQWLFTHGYLKKDELRDVYYTRSTKVQGDAQCK